MLDHIPSHEELMNMSYADMDALAADIRTFVVEKTAKKGGHLSSNLGTVEMTLALFRAFDLPKDKVIWDVGHQSYAYKLLSGRMEGFDTLRDLGGMSGFPKCRESVYDSFDTGHSSTSISAGLGYARARDLLHEDYQVVSIIGDGSMTGGEAFEALNNAAMLNTNFIIILNDNEMSISRNVGGMRKYLTQIRSAKGYNRAKENVKKTLRGIPRIGAGIVDRVSHAKDALKEMVMPSGMVFENLGITYLGPVDGHSVQDMEKIFLQAKELNRCVLIHVMTRKGRGYGPAEENPERYHGVNPFDPATGEELRKRPGLSYSEVFGRYITHAAEEDENICAITAAMTSNVGLQDFRNRFPERFFDVGIAEQHAVTFAAGLALGGLHPYTAIFSSFLQRAYDQIVHDVCMQDLPVVFAVDRAGIVGRDGETHQGAFDISYLSSIPNMTVMAPKDGAEFEKMLAFSRHFMHPLAIRYPRGTALNAPETLTSDPGDPENKEISYGKAEVLRKGTGILILAVGNMVSAGERTAELLEAEGVGCTLVNMRFVKPWDETLVADLLPEHELVVTLEDGVLSGGFGERVAAFIASSGTGKRVIPVGIPDQFVPQGNTEDLMKVLHMDAESIAERILKETREH